MITTEQLKNIDDRTLRYYRKQMARLDQEVVQYHRCFRGDSKRVLHEHCKELEKMLTAEINRREREYLAQETKSVDWSESPWIIAEPVIEDPAAIERIRKQIEELEDKPVKARYCPYCGNESESPVAMSEDLYECEACGSLFTAILRKKGKKLGGL